MFKKWIIIGILFFSTKIFSYSLPQDYQSAKWISFKPNSQNTYDVSVNFNHRWINIYITEKGDLSDFELEACSQQLWMIEFSYAQSSYLPTAVFYNKNDNHFSLPYPNSQDQDSYLCPENKNFFISADDANALHFLILQPVFKNQPKVWILVKRNFNISFLLPTEPDTHFLDNGNLFLVEHVKTAVIGNMPEPVPDKTETIPIDYSIFEKPVTQPTCYAMPEDHILRPCTPEEAKLRTPALKVFLGEK
jgi:hypothetical protein